LGGWFLTDDESDPTRWRIPTGTFLSPDSYLLIWASGKPGRTNPAAPLHTNFRLDAAGENARAEMPPNSMPCLINPFALQGKRHRKSTKFEM